MRFSTIIKTLTIILSTMIYPSTVWDAKFYLKTDIDHDCTYGILFQCAQNVHPDCDQNSFIQSKLIINRKNGACPNILHFEFPENVDLGFLNKDKTFTVVQTKSIIEMKDDQQVTLRINNNSPFPSFVILEDEIPDELSENSSQELWDYSFSEENLDDEPFLI